MNYGFTTSVNYQSIESDISTDKDIEVDLPYFVV
jgi:hypothetical protein